MQQHASALDIGEGDELYWHSGLFAGRTDADPGGVLRITMVDEERAIRRYKPGDVVSIALDLSDDGGINEVVAMFTREGASGPAITLRGHGDGAVEAQVTLHTRLRSRVVPGSYRCKYIEVRDLGGNPYRIHPDDDIRIHVIPVDVAVTLFPSCRGGGSPLPMLCLLSRGEKVKRVLVLLLVSFMLLVSSAPTALAQTWYHPNSGDYWYCDYYGSEYWCYGWMSGTWFRSASPDAMWRNGWWAV